MRGWLTPYRLVQQVEPLPDPADAPQERGELELRVTKLLQECKQEGNIILMIDEVRCQGRHRRAPAGACGGIAGQVRQAFMAGIALPASIPLPPPLERSTLRFGATAPSLVQVHTLVGAGAVGRGGGGGGGLDISNLIKPALARGDLQCIGATTLDEHRKHIERDAALER